MSHRLSEIHLQGNTPLHYIVAAYRSKEGQGILPKGWTLTWSNRLFGPGIEILADDVELLQIIGLGGDLGAKIWGTLVDMEMAGTAPQGAVDQVIDALNRLLELGQQTQREWVHAADIAEKERAKVKAQAVTLALARTLGPKVLGTDPTEPACLPKFSLFKTCFGRLLSRSR